MAPNRVVLITGAGRGIGAAIARRFAQPGTLLALWQRDEATLADTVDVVRARGGEVCPMAVDVRDRARVSQVVSELVQRAGRIDVLVNNAGTISRQSIAETDEADWDRVFDTNVKGVLWCIQAVAPTMVEQGRGAIINVSSVAGSFGNRERAAYCASKAAVNALTQVAALELGPRGVRVNAIAPGFIRTEINELELREHNLEGAFARRISLGRIGDVDEVASAAHMLASDDASYVNGEILVVDGGWTIAQNFPRPENV